MKTRQVSQLPITTALGGRDSVPGVSCLHRLRLAGQEEFQAQRESGSVNKVESDSERHRTSAARVPINM